MHQPQPLFLLSLPRSGSTLVQRILAAHGDVSTVSEPWIWLPLLYSVRRGGVYTEYHHPSSVKAIEGFIEALPGGEEDFFTEMRSFVLRLYARASTDGARYFLDKSPPYAFVADDLLRLFPDAKFVFLWRNPLGVAASGIEAIAGGRWNLGRLEPLLHRGLANLVEAYRVNASRCYALRFEDLLTDPTPTCAALFEYLDLPFDPTVLERFSAVRLTGRVGDRTGALAYGALSDEPLEKWTETMSTPLRKAWARRYVRWIGEERLRVMGYDLFELLGQVEGLRPSRLGLDDAVQAPYQMAVREVRSFACLASRTYGAKLPAPVVGEPVARG